MLINGQEHRISLLILFMEHELEVTLKTLAHLLPQVEESVTVSVLHNGGPLQAARDQIGALPGVSYYEAGSNLGVAGGRNFLFDTPECRGADIVMFVDNDVLLPTDYVRRSAAFLLERPSSGVVGSAVIFYRLFEEHLGAFPTPLGVLGQIVHQFTNDDVSKTIAAHPERQWFDHLGSHPDWRMVYMSVEPIIEQTCLALGATGARAFYPMLCDDPALRRRVITGVTDEIEVCNMPGCCQTFRRSLVDELDGLCDDFNPFGFEDVDFSIRAMKAGYTNYCDPRGFMIHGTDARHAARREPEQQARVERNVLRCLTLLAMRHEPDQYEELIQKQIISRFLLRRARGSHSLELLYATLVGFGAGAKGAN